MSRGPGKCQLCPRREILTPIQRGYSTERIKVCQQCLLRIIQFHRYYTRRGGWRDLKKDSHQLTLF